MVSVSTTRDCFWVTFLILTWGYLFSNGNALPQSPEINGKQTSLESRLHDLENLVQKLVTSIGKDGYRPNGESQQTAFTATEKKNNGRTRRALNITDSNLSGQIMNPLPRGNNDLDPIGSYGSGVSGCSAGLNGRDGRDGRDGPAGLSGRDGNVGLKGERGLRGDKGETGERGEQGQNPDTLMSSNGGTLYVRWGRITCPESVELVYQGIAAGSHYRNSGSGANLLCLPNDPEYLVVQAGAGADRGRIFSTEYELFGANQELHNHEVPCAVCSVPQRGRMLMIPAKITCPANWTSEYRGYLMAERADYHRGEYVCIDENAEARPGGNNVNEDGHLLHRVESRCSPGNLPCLPYVNGYELTCVVCTI